MPERVHYELRDAIATITMDDGKANALSTEVLTELGRAFDQAAADRAVVVLTGRAGVFSGGFDMRVLGSGGLEAVKMFRTGFELLARIHAFPAPVIVACTGHAIAMGAFLLLVGDYRVGATGPHKIAVNEVALGITMPYSGIEVCRQRLSPACFQRAVLNSERFGPEEAVVAGFLDRVVPAPELSDVARQVAAELAKLDVTVHTATKLRVRAKVLDDLRAAIEADDAYFRSLG